jgi:ATP-dependent helicase/DNAse subunit B
VIDDPEIVTSIDPRSRGSIVHETLERFVGEEIAGVLELDDGRERLSAIADEVIATYERAGKTGKRVLLHAERRRIKADLEAERERDLARRAASGERPLAVEYGFGYGDVPPVVIEVGERSISFRGKIDRADLTDDGSVTVIDYKTGRPGPFEAISADPVDAGRHLQLPIYALAATRLSASPTSRIRAEFRFVGSRPAKNGEFAIGVELDDAVQTRLVETLGVLTGTVAAGFFPMVPGKAQWGSYKNCDFCNFNSVCPTGREYYEESARRTGRAEEYFDLIGGLVEDVPQAAGDESEESDE